MLKVTIQNIVKKHGKPKYVSVQVAPSLWNRDCSIYISWGSKKNQTIAKNFMTCGNGFVVTWRNDKPLCIKSFRQNGSKVSAEVRANEYVEKVNRWAEL